MNTYSVNCRKDTDYIYPKIVRTKNNRLVMRSKCSFVELKNQDLLKNKKQKLQ